MKQSFASLAVGSSMWHGSHTYVGQQFDNNLMAVIGFLAHQFSVSGLKYSPELTDLNTTARNATALETAADVTAMFYTKTVP